MTLSPQETTPFSTFKPAALRFSHYPTITDLSFIGGPDQYPGVVLTAFPRWTRIIKFPLLVGQRGPVSRLSTTIWPRRTVILEFSSRLGQGVLEEWRLRHCLAKADPYPADYATP
ncbi:hypothetical protein Y032_0322g2449 [Ancylostoma ceylanicum]|uniref:Uncharacterized protein n=1 Tax=Ancylostoma ceylanicum TaxID=53326 RepID=A0A016S0K0_9BILA|nr:hypothetical protein Y032_0322g2449 [Ancylostoma ceylanicum]